MAISENATSADLDPISSAGRNHKSNRPHRYGTQIFLAVLAAVWLVPLLWTLYTSLRTKTDTDRNGYFSVPKTLTLSNYTSAWSQGGFAQAFKSSAYITIPSVRPDHLPGVDDGICGLTVPAGSSTSPC